MPPVFLGILAAGLVGGCVAWRRHPATPTEEGSGDPVYEKPRTWTSAEDHQRPCWRICSPDTGFCDVSICAPHHLAVQPNR
jgi:hypothetical protein